MTELDFSDFADTKRQIDQKFGVGNWPFHSVGNIWGYVTFLCDVLEISNSIDT